jgi:DUF2934 family protein
MARPRKTKSEIEPKAAKPARRRAALTPVTAASDSAHSVEISHERITISAEEVASEAYRLFLARGGQHGDALTDWLTAERIVRDRRLNGAA